MHRPKFTLVQAYIFFLPENGKDYENEFLQKKNIIWDKYNYASFTAG